MLLTSIGYGDDIQTLNRNLDVIPSRLNTLYEKLLTSVNKHNRNECDKYLSPTLMNTFIDAPSAFSYSWVKDLEELGFPPKDVSAYSKDETMHREKLVHHQLDKLTKGLLEVVKTKSFIRGLSETHPWVQFLHRMFREFLLERLPKTGFLEQFSGSTPGEIYVKSRLPA